MLVATCQQIYTNKKCTHIFGCNCSFNVNELAPWCSHGQTHRPAYCTSSQGPIALYHVCVCVFLLFFIAYFPPSRSHRVQFLTHNLRLLQCVRIALRCVCVCVCLCVCVVQAAFTVTAYLHSPSCPRIKRRDSDSVALPLPSIPPSHLRWLLFSLCRAPSCPSLYHSLSVCVCVRKRYRQARTRWKREQKIGGDGEKVWDSLNMKLNETHALTRGENPLTKWAFFFFFFFLPGSRFSFCLLQIPLISLFLPARLFLETFLRARQSAPLCPLTSSLYRCLSPSQLLVMNPSHFFDFRCGEASRGPRASCIKRANQHSFSAWRMICHGGRGENNV